MVNLVSFRGNRKARTKVGRSWFGGQTDVYKFTPSPKLNLWQQPAAGQPETATGVALGDRFQANFLLTAKPDFSLFHRSLPIPASF
jgi:hypothetical protein